MTGAFLVFLCAVWFGSAEPITPANVGRLEVAWTYHTGELNGDNRRFEARPIVVDGTMYISTPLGRVIAVDPETGTERWKFDARVDSTIPFGDYGNRGVTTWLDRTAPVGSVCRRRIIAPIIDARIVSLDAANGTLCTQIDLRVGLRNAPYERAEYELTSPPAVIGDIIVTGSAVADNNRRDAASGEVRGFDARTGKLLWTWDPVVQDSTDPAWSTWQGAHAHATGAANAWSIIAADSTLGLVFVPTSSPSPDYYGGERLGDNRYGNSIVALHARTGKVAWHFQTVHHDLWDYDNASPPVFATVKRSGRDIPVVLQATKTGMLFVFERATGKPVYPVEERPVPASTVPGEQAARTQPFSSIVLSPHTLKPSEIAPECGPQVQGLRNEGIFTPPSLEGTLVIPSNVGGAHWGGVAVDNRRGIAVVPVNRIASLVQIVPFDSFKTAVARENSQRLGDQYTRMRGTPYVVRRRILRTPGGYMCSPPPYGSLVAVNLQTGKIIWDVPLGVFKLPGGPAIPGTISLGGPITTSTGLTFIGATVDRRIRAFDTMNGKELWSAALPAGARATPMTFVGRSGKQYVVIAAGGGDVFGKGDALIAFALPGR